MMVQLTRRLAFINVASLYPCVVAVAPCRVQSTPTVSVDIRRDEVREVVDTSREELNRLANAAGVQAHWPALGMYASAIGYEIDIESHVEPLGDAAFCTVATAVRIHVALSNRVIHLARDAQLNGCLYEAVREHAWLHAHADEQALEKQGSALLDHMRTTLKQTPLARANSVLAAKSKMAAAIRTHIDEELKGVELLREQLDQSIDSPSSLAQLRGTCGDLGQNSL
jgi:hypothetical protein